MGVVGADGVGQGERHGREMALACYPCTAGGSLCPIGRFGRLFAVILGR